MENLRRVGEVFSVNRDQMLGIYVPDIVDDEELLDVSQECSANLNELKRDLGIYRRVAVVGVTLSLAGGLLSEGNPSFLIPAAGTLLSGSMSEITTGLSELRYRNVKRKVDEAFLND